MQNGDQVVVSGSVEVYERTGSYQLYASHIVRDGVGELAERFEMLKKKLLEQGMFDESYKQPIPAYIRTLGVVTASTGAAVRDIIQISRRRNPYIDIVLYPAVVQGDAAPDSIVRGIRTLDGLGVDVIIIGRGGGSLEDLWAFNEEKVAEAVFDCSTPVISAVGHETDVVITDFVADLRAPTPSAAAELAVYDLGRYFSDLDGFRKSLDDAMQRSVVQRQTELRRLGRELHHLSPDAVIRSQRMTVDRAWTRLDHLMQRKTESARAEAQKYEKMDYLIRDAIAGARRRADVGDLLGRLMDNSLADNRHRLELSAGTLAHLSPLARLSGGYGFVADSGGRAIRSVQDVREGDLLCVHLRDGKVEASAQKIIPDDSLISL